MTPRQRDLAHDLGVTVQVENASEASEPPSLGPDALAHMHCFFAWDIAATDGLGVADLAGAA